MPKNPTQSNKPKTPKLRFPGFDGVWEEKKLGTIFSNKIKRNKDGLGIDVLTNSATQGIVSQRDYFDKDIAVQGNLENYYVVDIDDFIYNPRISNSAPVGPLKRNKLKKGVMSPLYTVLKPKEGDYTFLEKYFETSRWYRYMYKIANYGARHDRMAILQDDFMKMPVLFPQLPEQTKIASFLGRVDAWIKNLREQKKSLESYKKSLMQKIFSQQIRFKDENENDFPEWGLINLGDCLREKIEKTKQNNKYSVLSSTMKGLFLQSDYFNKDIASSDTTGYKILRKNQLVFSPQNLWLGNINLNKNFEIGIVSPSYKIFEIDTGIMLINYLNNILKSKRMLYEYELCSEQGASIVRRNLNLDLFNLIPIKIPSLSEQQKIAEFLSSVDTLLESKQQQIIEAEEWKKGLMQELFA